MMTYKPYKKDFDHSYALGVFPTIEALTHKPELIQTVLLSKKMKPSTGLARIKERAQQHSVRIETVEHSIMERLARTENCFAIGVFKKQNDALQANQSHVVLVNPDDMGNVGTIMRTMLGFAAHDLAVITPAADPFDPKTIRASMGAFFSLRVAHFASFADYQKAFPTHHPYPFMLGGRHTLADVTFKEPASLIFGNEGAGLPAEFAAVGTTITIEQSAEIDSLNLALSVGIVLYKKYTI